MNDPVRSGAKPQRMSVGDFFKAARKHFGLKGKTPKDGGSNDKNAEADKEIPPASGKCYLLDDLPPEVRNYIWKLSVTADDPIVPIQLCRKSNKFLWSNSQLVKEEDGVIKKKASAVKPLTVVQLTQVCHQIYDEVSNTHLFYALNHFNFRRAEPTTYLLAITEPRRNAIRSITCAWDNENHHSAQMFTVLAACERLQVLHLMLSEIMILYYGLDYSKFPGLIESKVAVRGLKKLTVDLTPPCMHTWSGVELQEEEALCKALESLFVEEMAKPRGKAYNLRIFTQAQLDADLDVHGTGRLSGDKKPNIASRTRQQLRNADRMTEQGTMPKRETPKYDLNGDLAWYVQRIDDSRKVESDDGGPSVEFRVKCLPESRPEISPARWYPRRETTETITSWEAVSVLHSAGMRWDIVQFYAKNRNAFGMQETRDAWKLRSEDDEKLARQHASALKQLDTLIKKEAQVQLALEAARLVEEAKVEKQNAKATKTVAKLTAVAKNGPRGSKAGRRY